MKVRFSIKGKFLILIVGIVSFCNIGVGIISLRTANNVIKQSATKLLTSISDDISHQVYQINEREFCFLEGIAAMPVMYSEDVPFADKCKYVTSIAMKNTDKYQNIGFYNEKGIATRDDGTVMDLSDRDYFKEAFKGKRYLTAPFITPTNNSVIQIYSVPVYNGNKVVGVLCSLIKGNNLDIITKASDIGNGNYPVIIDRNTLTVVGDVEGQNTLNIDAKSLDSNSEYGKIFNKLSKGETGVSIFVDPSTNVKMIASYRAVDGSDSWSTLCLAPFSVYSAGWNKMHNNVVFTLLFGIVLGIVLAGILIRMLVKPLTNVENKMTDISMGNADLTQRITQTTYDEVGMLVDGFNNFTAKMQDIVKDIKHSNDYLDEVGQDLDASTDDTSRSISEIIGSIDEVHNQIEFQSNSVQQTAGAVNQIASNIESLEKMIEKQSAGVSEASSAVEQMIGNINSVNTSVDNMAKSFENLISSAKSGSEVQSEVNMRIEEIRVQSESLQEANIAIASIAEQTNLLAMNAAIEAAHAGEAGKGFSVVADEIRKLSETSSQQSKTIGNQLTDIQNSIQSVVDACNKSSDAFDTMTSGIHNTDGIVRLIKDAMEEQTAGSKQINSALNSMNDSTHEVRTAGREMAEGNKQILAEVKNLQDATVVMKSSMNKMSDSARKIDETGIALVDISKKMRDSIAEIGSQIGQFKV